LPFTEKNYFHVLGLGLDTSGLVNIPGTRGCASRGSVSWYLFSRPINSLLKLAIITR